MIQYIYIAGASSRARTTREYLEFLNGNLKVSAYLVSPEMPDRDKVFGGLHIYPISEQSKLNTQYPVYIGTRGVNQRKIERELRKIGFHEIIFVTPELDTSLRNQYVKAIFARHHRQFTKIEDLTYNRHIQTEPDDTFHSKPVLKLSETGDKINTASIYVVNTAGTDHLKDTYTFLSEEKIIQAGTALTRGRIPGAAYDNVGDNISENNHQFCELTALYWIWKHVEDDYIGMVHYRRHFLLPDHWLNRMQDNHIDVLLPVPLYVAPTLEENFRMRHIPVVWDVMLSKLKEIHPEDYGFISDYLRSSGLYSPCNMFVMKHQILREYCEWLFPILFAVADEVGYVNDSYQNRYPGFLSERLMTAYFAMHEDEYRIIYADKNFLK